jgi:hypothetical protein
MSISFMLAVCRAGWLIKWLLLFIFIIFLSSIVLKIIPIAPEWAFLASIAVVLGLWSELRRIRQICLLSVCRFMVASGRSALMRFGVWELLRVGERFRPGDMPDYGGLLTLHKTYELADPLKQYRVRATIRELEEWPGCPEAKCAALLLEAIEHQERHYKLIQRMF